MDTGLGLRIRARRNELHMTQAELAKKLGYKTKSSITKIEQGVSDITQTQVKLTAEERRREVRDTEKQRAVIDRKIERLKELFLAEQITLDEYKADRAELEAQKAELTVETPEPDLSGVNGILAIKDIKSLIEELSPTERRYLWRGLIEEIIFFPDRHFEVHFK